jgi:hypothetical protein
VQLIDSATARATSCLSRAFRKNRSRLTLALFRRFRARAAITPAVASFCRFARPGNHQRPVQTIGISFPDCHWLRSSVSPADGPVLAIGSFVAFSARRCEQSRLPFWQDWVRLSDFLRRSDGVRCHFGRIGFVRALSRSIPWVFPPTIGPRWLACKLICVLVSLQISVVAQTHGGWRDVMVVAMRHGPPQRHDSRHEMSSCIVVPSPA